MATPGPNTEPRRMARALTELTYVNQYFFPDHRNHF